MDGTWPPASRTGGGTAAAVPDCVSMDDGGLFTCRPRHAGVRWDPAPGAADPLYVEVAGR